MLASPQRAIDEGWIKCSKYSQKQQSGVDVSIEKLTRLSVDENSSDIVHTDIDFDTAILIKPGIYTFLCNEYVKIPQDYAALLIVRSSLNRRGTFITTGLYDNGFENFIGGTLRVGLPILLSKNERIAQIIFMKSEAVAQYEGQYQGGKRAKER